MEVARTFGELLRRGWRPRRSILFCSWAVEEYGLGGSYEWVYENKVGFDTVSVDCINIKRTVEGRNFEC